MSDRHDIFLIRDALCFETEGQNAWSRRDLLINSGYFAPIEPDIKYKLDGFGKWITPGLIDCHVHICGETNTNLAKKITYPEPEYQSLQRGLSNALDCIIAGITTVRDMGTFQRRSAKIREWINNGYYTGPRMIICGNIITGIRGHGWELGVETAPEDLLARITEEAAENMDWIKIINDPIYFESRLLSEGVSFAHQLGHKVACHAYTRQSIKIAIESAVDSIEHAFCWNKSIIEQILEAGIALVPTCVAASHVVKNPTQALVRTVDPVLSVFESWWNELERHLPNTLRSNVRIGVGSDAGFPPTVFGKSLWNEMQILNDFGMPWRQCLIAATRNNAKILRRLDLGTLDDGGCADFVVFDRDPLEVRAKAVEHITAVYKAGRCVSGTPLTSC